MGMDLKYLLFDADFCHQFLDHIQINDLSFLKESQ